MKRLSELFEDYEIKVTLGEPEEIEDYPDPDAVVIPVSINGIEHSTDEINLVVTPFEKDGKILYRLDINLYQEYRHKGIGYKIYSEFLKLYGNIMSYGKFRINDKEIPEIYKKLEREPGVNVERTGDDIFLYTDEWVKNN